MSGSGPWAVAPRPDPSARLRLFCFPHAGGAASGFVPWAGELPPGVELVAVQPPGRERRIAEPPMDRMGPFADAAYEALLPLWDRPFLFFGHSTGALVAFELCRRLRRDGRPLPVQVVASGRWAPHLPDPEPPVYALPDEELIAALRRYGGTPEEVLSDRDLMAFLLPLLRADFSLGDTYRYRDEPPLPVPITAVGGDRDPRVPRASLEAWGQHTTGAFRVELLPGDHFYLHADRGPVLRVVADLIPPTLLAR